MRVKCCTTEQLCCHGYKAGLFYCHNFFYESEIKLKKLMSSWYSVNVIKLIQTEMIIINK